MLYRSLLFSYFVYSSLYLLVPNFSFIPPLPSPFGNNKIVFSVCESVLLHKMIPSFRASWKLGGWTSRWVPRSSFWAPPPPEGRVPTGASSWPLPESLQEGPLLKCMELRAGGGALQDSVDRDPLPGCQKCWLKWTRCSTPTADSMEPLWRRGRGEKN